MPEWLSIAIEGSTVRRGLKFALVVGTVLIAINHGDALLAGDVDPRRVARMSLTAVVPYLVSTFSTVAARLQMKRHMPDRAGRVE